VLIAAAIVGAGILLIFPAVSNAGDPIVTRHPVYGGAEAFFGTCTGVGIPPAGTVCTDKYVLFWNGYAVEGGGPVAPPQAPWQIYAQTVRLEFDGTDGPPAVLNFRWGYELLDAGAYADEVHLDTASVSAALPMSDGSTFDFTGTWQAWSDRLVYGNSGPSTGVDHLYVDRCLTIVANGHQKFRNSNMTGTVSGVPVHSYTDFISASIFNNDFQYIVVPHGGCP